MVIIAPAQRANFSYTKYVILAWMRLLFFCLPKPFTFFHWFSKLSIGFHPFTNSLQKQSFITYPDTTNLKQNQNTNQWIDELDALIASPQHHKLLFEHGFIKVLVTMKKETCWSENTF
jgi:hypothetical protein